LFQTVFIYIYNVDMSIVNPAPQPQLIVAQTAICKTPGGKWLAKQLIRQYNIKEIIGYFCKDANIFINEIIEIMKSSSQVPHQAREYLENNREKFVSAINEIKVKYNLDSTCSRIQFIKTEEGFSKVFDAIINLFCVIPFGATITQNNTKKIYNATMNINKIFSEGRNNRQLIKLPNKSIQSSTLVAGGKRKTINKKSRNTIKKYKKNLRKTKTKRNY
jgi:hypothetical protein